MPGLEDSWGKGRSSRIIFLPDWFVNPDREWENQQAFRDRYQCLFFRLTGTDGPHDVSEASPLEANERRLVKIITEGSDSLRIVAHGISCLLAVRIAALFPSRVSSMILINPRHSYKEHRLVYSVLSRLPRIFIPLYLLLSDPLGEKGSAVRRVRDRLRVLPAVLAGRYMRDLSRADVHPLLEQVTADVFIIAGDRDDENSVRYAEEMNEEFRSSQLIRYANLGHNPHREDPELLNIVMLEFLKGRQSLLERGLDTIRNFMRRLLGTK